MKQKIIIKEQDTIVYQGKIADMPIKEQAIVSKSLELFDDDDPCIIHQSYVIKEYVDVTLHLLQSENPLLIKTHMKELSFLQLKNPELCVIILEG